MSIEITGTEIIETVYAVWTPDEDLRVKWPLWRGPKSARTARVTCVDITLTSTNGKPFYLARAFLAALNVNRGGVIGAAVSGSLYGSDLDMVPGLRDAIAAALELAETARRERS